MKFKFIANAGGIFSGNDGTTVLCDPWLDDGVFEGGWCHYPPVKTKREDLKNVSAIYLSHLHADHYDERFFDYPRDIPIFCLDHGPAFLIKKLKIKGYSNIIPIKDGETVSFNEFKITLYAPFSKNAHHSNDTEVGNIIDSAMVIESAGLVALNANDNTPSIESCSKLLNNHGHIDLAMINYNAAGPYPSCFKNFTEEEKKSESDRILKRNFDHMINLSLEMKAKHLMPFAGSYVIGGRNYLKNEYLGTTTCDICAQYVKDNSDIDVFCLNENGVFDLELGKQAEPYRPISIKNMKKYLKDVLSIRPYTYDHDEKPNMARLMSDLENASDKMKVRMDRIGLKPKTNVYFDVGGDNVCVYKPYDESEDIKLLCSMDPRLLRRILDREAHWDNAQIGCHVEFERLPNTYEPDIHLSLSFLHL